MTVYTTGASATSLPGIVTGRYSETRVAESALEKIGRVTGERKPKGDEREARQVQQALARSQKSVRPLDPEILQRAKELVESIDIGDQATATVNLAEAGTLISSLWENSHQVSVIHKEILAALDAGILHAMATESITQDQVQVFREAIGDLGMETVSETQADAIRSRFIDLGKQPLFILTGAIEGDANDRDDPR